MVKDTESQTSLFWGKFEKWDALCEVKIRIERVRTAFIIMENFLSRDLFLNVCILRSSLWNESIGTNRSNREALRSFRNVDFFVAS